MTFDIGTVRFDTKQRFLQKEALKRHLEPKVFDLLFALVEADGKLVTREQLIDTVWKGRVVGEGAINRTVSLLRAHFSALTEEEVVETVPTQGYRLKLSVRQQETVSVAKPQAQTVGNVRRYTSLGVIALVVVLFAIAIGMIEEKPEKHSVLKGELGPIIALNGAEYLLSASKDGKRILFHHQDQQQKVVLFDAETLQQRVVLQNAHAAISPDGQQVIYVQNEDKCIVSVMDADSTKSRSLFDCEQFPSAIGWGSENLIFFNKRFSKSHPYQVYSYHLKTERLQQVTNPKSDNNTRGDFQFAANSLTGELAVLRYIDEANTAVIVYQGQTEVERWNIDKGLKNITWHPNNRDLIVAERNAIYQFLRDTAETVEIKRLTSVVNSIVVVNDDNGASLLMSNSVIRSDAMAFNFQTKRHELWQQSGGMELLPRYESDTQMLLSTRHKSHRWWQLDSGEPAIVSVELPFELSFLRYELSADGHHILLTKLGALYEVDVKERKYQKLFDEQSQAYVANYSSGNKDHIVFSSNQSGQWQLWQFDRTTKTKTQLTFAGGYSGRVWQGNLYYSKFTSDGLWVKAPDSEQETLLISDFDRINWLNWQIRGENLYFYRPDSGIWRYNLATETSNLVMETPENFIHQYTVSPKQDKLYWIHRTPAQGDIYRYTFQ